MAAKKLSKTKKSAPTRERTPARATSTTKSTKTASKGSGKTATKKNEKKEVKSKTRPASKKSSTAPAKTKKTTSKKSSAPSNRGGANREMDEVTGFAVGTDSQFIAEVLLEGAESRQAVIDYLRDELDGETRNGTEKPVANLVSGVVNKMLERGFTIESSYRLVPPVKGAKKSKGRARK